MSYMHDGNQFIVVAFAGRAGNMHPSASRSGFRRISLRGDHRSHTEHLLSITF